MNILIGVLGGLSVTLFVLVLVAWAKVRASRETIEQQGRAANAARDEAAQSMRALEETASRTQRAQAQAITEARRVLDQQLADAVAETDRVRSHYEAEARRIKDQADEALSGALSQVDALQKYESLLQEEGAATRLVAEAITEAERLKRTADQLLEAARTAAADQQAEARGRASEARASADAILDRATREAGRLVEDAHRRAHEIGGDAYLALRDKQGLEEALVAIRNIIDGYGDRYVVPTRSILDDLAADFGHTEAGQALAAAREQSTRMVEEGQAATCDYAEPKRRDTAIRFVIAAFNGRVDAILSRSRHDNLGTLTQEIRDAYALVNLDGTAFRNARVLSPFLDARLAELRWAVAAQELRLKEREEQRRLKEQIREEERARREYEQAIAAAQREERTLAQALAKAREEAALATAGERAELEERIAELNDRLAEAEAQNQRALSMAQQTRKGTIYVISNVGSFGEDVFKIGMTRRLEPRDRVKELGDASVPFEFDIHAMIPSDDAPELEARLHREFENHRLNKVNYRKEFFRASLEQLRERIMATSAEASFTMLAEAREYRETQALTRMTSEERAKYDRKRVEPPDRALADSSELVKR
jgi:hypothetical protein